MSNNAEFNFRMMTIAGIVVCGASLAALSIYAFPTPNKKNESK